MQEQQTPTGPKYSIGIVGIPLPEGREGFLAPKRTISLDGGEYIERDHHCEIRVATKGRGVGRIQSVAEVSTRGHMRIALEEFATLSFSIGSVAGADLVEEIEIDLADFARATIVLIPKGEGSSFYTLRSTLGKGAELTIAQGFSEGEQIKYSETHQLLGEDSGVHVVTLLAPQNETRLDLVTFVEHLADRSHGHVRALGFLRGNSKTIYRAMGTIQKHVQAPDSNEQARFLILDRGAEISAIPSLDIESDHVVTSHKLAISQLGENELFYQKTRGLSDLESRSMMLGGLLQSELACIKNEELVRELTDTIAYD